MGILKRNAGMMSMLLAAMLADNQNKGMMGGLPLARPRFFGKQRSGKKGDVANKVGESKLDKTRKKKRRESNKSRRINQAKNRHNQFTR